MMTALNHVMGLGLAWVFWADLAFTVACAAATTGVILWVIINDSAWDLFFYVPLAALAGGIIGVLWPIYLFMGLVVLASWIMGNQVEKYCKNMTKS